MLKKLHIENYAIIEEIEINFSSQLNIITGETGAGKSILIGALSLILGERADPSVLLEIDKKCIIEGIFSINNKTDVKNFLRENDLDNEDDELMMRREIAPSGKSRGFINDTPATLHQLKALASLLVDLHQQFDTLELGDSDFQREVLDALADNFGLLQAYQSHYKSLVHAKKELTELQKQKDSFNKELDYRQFLFDELKEVNLIDDELEDLDKELKLLSNSEGIKTALTKVCFELKDSEQPLVQLLKQYIHLLNPYAAYHSKLPPVIERLQSSQIELQDISDELDTINESIHFDEKRVEWVNERLSNGYKLLKKHGVHTTKELLDIQNELKQQIQAVLNIGDTILEKEKQVINLQTESIAKANQISKARHQQITPLETQVNKLLIQVGMPNARLKISVSAAALGEYGNDEIEFLFDANKSDRFEPIRKVASGGELSRLMLCIKSLIAQSIDLPTMIFDEIDTGISGEAAKQVGLIMKSLSSSRQMICITHQPQIAGKASTHFFVYKEIRENKVKTNIRLLTQDERITAIAKMLSGERPTAAALENAREMIMN
jgi:DNA repair protein RecN (Recombination protein N)